MYGTNYLNSKEECCNDGGRSRNHCCCERRGCCCRKNKPEPPWFPGRPCPLVFPVGPQGSQGPQRPQGSQDLQRPQGPQRPQGSQDLQRPQGSQGSQEPTYEVEIFYALMMSDNTTAVAAGANVDFPQTAATSGTNIVRVAPGAFSLTEPGNYLVQFQVSANEASKLVLTLNGTELPYTVAGRAAETSQIVGMAIVTTIVANSVLTVRNPASSTTALTLTPQAGGGLPVSAHLVILKIS